MLLSCPYITLICTEYRTSPAPAFPNVVPRGCSIGTMTVPRPGASPRVSGRNAGARAMVSIHPAGGPGAGRTAAASPRPVSAARYGASAPPGNVAGRKGGSFSGPVSDYLLRHGAGRPGPAGTDRRSNESACNAWASARGSARKMGGGGAAASSPMRPASRGPGRTGRCALPRPPRHPPTARRQDLLATGAGPCEGRGWCGCDTRVAARTTARVRLERAWRLSLPGRRCGGGLARTG